MTELELYAEVSGTSSIVKLTFDPAELLGSVYQLDIGYGLYNISNPPHYVELFSPTDHIITGTLALGNLVCWHQFNSSRLFLLFKSFCSLSDQKVNIYVNF